MRLSQFIRRNLAAIEEEWEAFAATLLPAAASMTAEALRDHAQQILEAVAKDLESPQTVRQQLEKSRGQAAGPTTETAAQTHAVLRARGGFDLIQLVAEYRALRASVIRLWVADGAAGEELGTDLIRFNEAIDQAVAESVGHFHRETQRARNLLLGMLGHDMRSPLNAILMTSSHLAELNAGEEVSVAAARLIRSGASIQALLDDLLDFGRTNLGLGVNIEPEEIDLAVVVADEVDGLRAEHPRRRIELETGGDLRGRWDPARVKQVLRNLISNAVQFGASDTPVRVVLRGGDDDVRLEVANEGQTLDPSVREQIFEPLRRAIGQDQSRNPRSGLGLGLFIVREIARAHGGEVELRSDEGETIFSVALPRSEQRAAS